MKINRYTIPTLMLLALSAYSCKSKDALPSQPHHTAPAPQGKYFVAKGIGYSAQPELAQLKARDEAAIQLRKEITALLDRTAAVYTQAGSDIERTINYRTAAIFATDSAVKAATPSHTKRERTLDNGYQITLTLKVPTQLVLDIMEQELATE